jgi:hypothetical protein
MSRFLSLALAAALLACVAAAPARADDAADFMQRFGGEWLGSGQLLVGAENGVKFHCELKGDPSRTQLTFNMSGRCWMGSLSAPVFARMRYNSDQGRFYGEFMDGSDGTGLDIVGKRAGEGFSLDLTRDSAHGRLAAETVNKDQMKITIFYRFQNRELPVVAMGFTRKEAQRPDLPSYMPEMVTGSIAREAK